MTTLKMKMVLSLLAALAMVGCGSSSRTDSGIGADGGTIAPEVPDARTTRDAPARADAFMMNSDVCAATDTDAISTVGCNGGFSSATPAANEFGGACTVGDETMPAGSCTGAGAVCNGPAGMSGSCLQACTPGSTYVSTGGCPTGARCFDLGGNGFCYRDCDATHACPPGQMCDGEGSCAVPVAG